MYFYTYDHWIKENFEDLDGHDELDGVIPVVECSTCHGEGVLECDLGHEHPCDDCDAMGKVEQDATEQYKNAVLSDIAKWAVWTGNWDSQRLLHDEFNEKLEKLLYSRQKYI